jgi:hypothetical protein
MASAMPIGKINMNYVVSSNNQPDVPKTDPKQLLPERIRTLLADDNSTTDQTTQSPKTLIKQLYNNRKSALENNSKSIKYQWTSAICTYLILDEMEKPDQEELPQIFHPSGNKHPKPHKQHLTTTQPPWYEFTTLYPGQRRTQQTLSPTGFYPTQTPTFFSNQISVQQQTPPTFQPNPSQWIQTTNIHRPQK